MTAPDGYPTYRELLEREGVLAGTSWGLFPDPQRGMPTFAGAEQAAAACGSVRDGVSFGLDYPLDAFDPGMSVARSAPTHTIYSGHPAHRDDYLDGFYLQGSSQIDGLRHRRSDQIGFYGGVSDDDVRVGTPALGVQVWADSPIVGRGVVLDLDGYRRQLGTPIDHVEGEPLPMQLIRDVIAWQDLTVEPGDIVMFHTGWAEWFLALEPDLRAEAIRRKANTGIEQSTEFLEWVWDSRLALVAADNFALERLPVVPASPFRDSAPNDRGMMHQELLAKLGLPLGELWRLGPLVSHLRSAGRWTALLTIKPLNLVGGTGSPGNVTAVC